MPRSGRAKRTAGSDEIQDALSFIVRWSRMSFYEEISTRSGERLDRSAITILSFLGDGVEMWHTELAALLGVDRSTVSRQVAATVDLGLVAGRQDDADKRATLLSLTPEGQAVHRKVTAAWESVISELLDGWDPAEVEQCGRLLSKLVSGMKDPYESPLSRRQSPQSK